jgi:hypothetical protein
VKTDSKVPSTLSNSAVKIAVDLDDEEVGASKGKKVKKALKASRAKDDDEDGLYGDTKKKPKGYDGIEDEDLNE